MNFGILAKRAGQLVANNSPAILTAVGATGVLTTAYLTGKATFNAVRVLDEAEEMQRIDARDAGKATFEGDLTTRQKFDLTWKMYIPAAGTALVTIACIVVANRIGMRRAAALATAYNLAEKAALRYKEKVVETIGEKKATAIKDAVAQDLVNEKPLSTSEIILIAGENTLCLDTWSGRYFTSDVETLKKAMNDTNYQINNNFEASLTEFWRRIGLPSTAESDDIGWTSEELLELDFSYTSADDGRPCLAVGFRTVPFREYGSVH